MSSETGLALSARVLLPTRDSCRLLCMSPEQEPAEVWLNPPSEAELPVVGNAAVRVSLAGIWWEEAPGMDWRSASGHASKAQSLSPWRRADQRRPSDRPSLDRESWTWLGFAYRRTTWERINNRPKGNNT